MAIIQDQDYKGFKIKITPEYTNWWSFNIEFFYKDKPLFNPEIIKGGKVLADEYSGWALLPLLEKAIACNTPNERFVWDEWEDEATITIEYNNFNQYAEGGFFVFEAFVSAWFFKDGNSNTGDQPAGLRLMIVERNTLKKFYEDLRSEMLLIHDKLPEDHKTPFLQNKNATQ